MTETYLMWTKNIVSSHTMRGTTLRSYVRHSQQELHLYLLTIKSDGDLSKNIVCRFTSVGVLSSSLPGKNSVGCKQPALTRVRCRNPCWSSWSYLKKFGIGGRDLVILT